MIKQLKRKIILITLLSVGVVLSIMVAVMNGANYYRVVSDSDHTLAMLGNNGGKFPSGVPDNKRPEERFDTRYFSLAFNQSGVVLEVDVSKIFAVSESRAIEMARDVLASGNQSGFVDNYRYLVVDGVSPRVIFLDTQRELNAFHGFLRSSLAVSLVGMFGVFALSVFFSRYLLNPVEEAYRKQRRFITDASHELKTPLTIMRVNMEVLELTNEENEWIGSTYRQIDRMSDMVGDMLYLAKLDEKDPVVFDSYVQINEILNTVLEDYEPMISNSFILDVQQEPVTIKGDGALIQRLFHILIENCVRYGVMHRPLKISLTQSGNAMHFKISNEAILSESGNYDVVFDRFKRLDEARTQSEGGSGIGLSIAAEIVTLHRGSIHAYSDDGTTFTISVKM